MAKEKTRMVGDYEVINSIHIGDKELILGENLNDPNGCIYMTCFATRNELLELCTGTLVSGDYLEIAEIYSDRLREQIAQAKEQRLYGKIITNDMCDNTIWNDNLEGKILVVEAKYLRPEYRNEKTQIILCKGGNGARPECMGMSIFGQECFSDESCKYHRGEIVGELKKEFYPDWLKEKLQAKNEIENNPNVFEYSEKHFVGVGYVAKKDDALKNVYSDTDLCISVYDNGTYNYNDFYKAANDSPFDIFRCIENNKNYIPGINELFGYNGKVEKEKPKPKEQTKSKKDKEMER